LLRKVQVHTGEKENEQKGDDQIEGGKGIFVGDEGVVERTKGDI